MKEGKADALPFYDVSSDDWYCDAVSYVYNAGLLTGVGEGKFEPHRTMDRAMLMTAFYRLAGSPAREMEKANRIFSLLVYVSLGLGVLITVAGIFCLRPVASLLGAEGQLLEDSVRYGRVVLLGLPGFILQQEFQSFFITAEKPKLGLAVTVAAGVTNMVLDAVLVIPFGLVGAALATAISQLVGGFVPFLYFARKNTSLLRLGKATFDGKALLKTCTNGSSELMSNVSMS